MKNKFTKNIIIASLLLFFGSGLLKAQATYGESESWSTSSNITEPSNTTMSGVTPKRLMQDLPKTGKSVTAINYSQKGTFNTTNFESPESIGGSSFLIAPTSSLNNNAITFRLNTDADGDGILDENDLDDDNDGILDTVECGSLNYTETFITSGAVTVVGGGASGSPIVNDAGPNGNQRGLRYTDQASGLTYYDVVYAASNQSNLLNSFLNFTIYTKEANEPWFGGTTDIILIGNGVTLTADLLTAPFGLTKQLGAFNHSIKINGATFGTTDAAVLNVLNNLTSIRIRAEFWLGATGVLESELIPFNGLPQCRDTDGDGIPDNLDLDSDNDGCPDAGEGGNTTIPKTSLVASAGTLQGGNGVNPATPPTSGSFNQSVLLNLGNTVGSTPTTMGIPTIAGTGQSIGSSTNALINACFCYDNPGTGTGVDTKHGITLLQRAGADNGNWPIIRKSAHTTLESNIKGFVISRMSTAQVNAIVNPQDGMMVYDTNLSCLKLYEGTAWSCFKTPTCP